MDIGTAKPSESELKKVPHHFISFLEPDEKYNIGKFETEALEKINSLFNKHDILFLTGGSGLYIDAVCTGIDELPEADAKVRLELNELYRKDGIKSLQKKLFELDPEYYSKVDLNNPHRLMRAIEVTLTSGKKYSSFRKNTSKERNFSVKKIGLLVDREELYAKINSRVNDMIKKGLVKEVESLLPYRNENALQTVGYKEIFEFLDGKISIDEAIDEIKQNTRNYAKRQMTWFRRDPEIKWYEPTEIDLMLRFINS
jgi:tRNA dimethylallyltransferase